MKCEYGKFLAELWPYDQITSNIHDMLTSCFNLSFSHPSLLLAFTTSVFMSSLTSYWFEAYQHLPIIPPLKKKKSLFTHLWGSKLSMIWLSSIMPPCIAPFAFFCITTFSFPCAPVLRGLGLCTPTGQSLWISIWGCSCPHCSTRPPQNKWTVSSCLPGT